VETVDWLRHVAVLCVKAGKRARAAEVLTQAAQACDQRYVCIDVYMCVYTIKHEQTLA
jgi:hypothetical protein